MQCIRFGFCRIREASPRPASALLRRSTRPWRKAGGTPGRALKRWFAHRRGLRRGIGRSWSVARPLPVRWCARGADGVVWPDDGMKPGGDSAPLRSWRSLLSPSVALAFRHHKVCRLAPFRTLGPVWLARGRAVSSFGLIVRFAVAWFLFHLRRCAFASSVPGGRPRHWVPILIH